MSDLFLCRDKLKWKRKLQNHQVVPNMQPSTSTTVTASSGEGTPAGQSEETATERGDDDTEEAKNSGSWCGELFRRILKLFFVLHT